LKFNYHFSAYSCDPYTFTHSIVELASHSKQLATGELCCPHLGN